MFIDVEQNSDEWYKLRVGKLTSSNFACIMAYNCEKWGAGAIEYAEKIALEIATQKRDESSSFKSAYMERGHELEPFAVAEYEEQEMRIVSNGGFYVSECGRFGDSPDGNVGENGCIEIKSVIPKTHWKRIKSNKMDPSYYWQVMGHILIGKKQWCDFISYCPEMPEGKKALVFRVDRDEEALSKLEKRLNEFWELVLENVELLK